jgi:dipeptidyl aminopeptidase/acylaminoacyl peptidase
MTAAPLVPRAHFFQAPVLDRLTVTPDGAYIVFVAPDAGIANVWMAPIARPQERVRLTDLQQSRLIDYRFDSSGKRILITIDDNGSERERLAILDVATRKLRFVDTPATARTEIVAVSAARPDTILIRVNDRNPEEFDLHLLDLTSLERRMVMTGEGVVDAFADAAFDHIATTVAQPDGGFAVVMRDGGKRRTITTIAADDSRGSTVLGLSGDGKSLFLINSMTRDRAALEAVDLASADRQLIAADPNADIARVLFSRIDGRPIAYRSDFLERRWVAIDRSFSDTFATLARKLPGSFDIISQSGDDRYWILRHDPVSRSPRYLIFDRQRKTITAVGDAFPVLQATPLVDMTAHIIRARDGLPLVSYLTLPTVKTKGPVPMVMWVHGGPWQRTYREFHATSQWLANRGYAVLTVNFRGSTGFGKAFVNAGDREWGGKMREDILDAAGWAVRQGIAKPDRIAISGISYGGYAALAGISMTPDRYACAMSMSGPVNLQTLLTTIPPYWRKEFEDLARRVGDPRTDQGRALLAAQSPLTHADAIKRPLLLVQGLNDPRVPPSEVTQLSGRLIARATPFTYLAFSDEGHVVSRPNSRMAYYAVFEQFLGNCLGGRVEPVGQELEQSSGKVTRRP